MAVLRRSMKKNKFCWDSEADKAFEELKSHLCELPTMVVPKPGETLILYLFQTDHTINSVLMVERGGAQIPIYFVSRTLKGPEKRYSPIENMVLSLVYTARKLRRYFQAHVIHVLTNKPLQQVLMKPEVSGRLAKWAIELGDHAIEYRPRTSFKGQILADFITESVLEDSGMLVNQKGVGDWLDKRTKQDPKEPLWLLYTDGASNGDGSDAGLILISPEGIELTYAIRHEFPSTNNEAEYEALLAGFRMAQKIKVRRIKAHVDSLLVANQIKGHYEAKDPKMVEYLKKVKELMQSFEKAELLHISRGMNKKADALSKLASVTFDHLAKDVKVETLGEPSIMEIAVANVEVQEENWITPILLYLREGVVPENKQEARRLRIKALQYVIIEGELYRRSYLGPSLKCVNFTQAEYIIREIHEGICGMHMGAKMVAARAMRAGYYWPAMFLSALREIQKCDSCQIYAPITRQPKLNLIPVSSSWPFQKWGINLVGPFPEGSRKARFLVVAIDYFTKWVEAKPLTTITGQQVKRFVWENIVCRFGLPHSIISDNGKQFANGPFKDWCHQLKIKQIFTYVAHPQANGQVERANRSIVEGI
ncbi:uncharacterized protein LOC143547243 [Bidens hawaiensis]|uniref:uncharacterized protein LOC143547243 n=1 Tax=Bidens hawaiensis TaxID=980011 RepID=UPI00404B8A8A